MRLKAARENATHYYGKVLSDAGDLKTSACCTADEIPASHKAILTEIEPEILERFYGCGSPIPPGLEGRSVLDLGCGTGRDAYLVSRLVGPEGSVIGVDMTDEQLAVAKAHVDTQMARFGYAEPNVCFRKGHIEDLQELGVEDSSVDVIISNCVINLSAQKEAVFSEIYRALKPGGELYFSDVYSDRRLPESLMEDPVLHGECLGGAMYFEDFRRLMAKVGFLDPRRVTSRPLTISDEAVADKLGLARFRSITIRAFKLNSLEDRCEDYGQVATYHGTISEWPHYFDLDDHHRFLKDKATLVCGNTAAMLQETRYSAYFTIRGDRSQHFGAFDCAPGAVNVMENAASGGSCC